MRVKVEVWSLTVGAYNTIAILILVGLEGAFKLFAISGNSFVANFNIGIPIFSVYRHHFLRMLVQVSCAFFSLESWASWEKKKSQEGFVFMWSDKWTLLLGEGLFFYISRVWFSGDCRIFVTLIIWYSVLQGEKYV